MNAISIYRAAHWLYRNGVPLLPKILQMLIFFLYNSYVPYQAVIGRGSRCGHRGIGVVINREAVIGDNVLIRAHVTIGKIKPDGPAPVIGNNVEIGDGAKILGGVRIGEDAVIGANAVVIRDVPAGMLAVGVPAVLKTTDAG